ncbi:DUF1499 domain-containing protein [Ruegeria sp. AD91A]|uniref:DUF1499 domain-containing protein n=1 Tax=Ruegeria sp. AD91A TaxID=2293862 RepID=UPI000E49C4F3|nr:DUF1499 domain-containing protein [Ruegeria sp. AD91A]AXT25827.1 DUF1499 domain-containing protein [Ruegeria sp. AD91A]
MKRMVLWAVIALVLGLGAYIRLAPSIPARWHVAPVAEVDQDLPSGVLRVVETGPDGLQRLDLIARATPRTSVLAGSVDEGMITYVTRTKWIGFPDYTTVQQDGDTQRIHGRLRFGRRDFGVNKARVDGWLGKM